LGKKIVRDFVVVGSEYRYPPAITSVSRDDYTLPVVFFEFA
jgi:hypothetical protein